MNVYGNGKENHKNKIYYIYVFLLFKKEKKNAMV